MFTHRHPHMMLLMFVLTMKAVVAASPSIALPDCPSNCGNVSIPYPFGIGKGCYKDVRYLVTCDTKNHSYWGMTYSEILNITLNGEAIANIHRYAVDCYNEQGNSTERVVARTDLRETPFVFSDTQNKFIALGCDTFAVIGDSNDKNFFSGCISVCSDESSVVNGSCSGIGCCSTSIPKGLKLYNVSLSSFEKHSGMWNFNPCSYAFLAKEDWYEFEVTDLDGSFHRDNIPVVLTWAIGNETCEEAIALGSNHCGPNTRCQDSTNGRGYNCFCNEGYEGNPYLPEGCQDIDECKDPGNYCTEGALCTNIVTGNYSCSCPKGYVGDGRKVNGTGCQPKVSNKLALEIALGISFGMLFLILGISSIYWVLRKRKHLMLKEKFFQQNGGLLLQKQLSSHGSSSETFKIFTSEELKKATNNYDEAKILGQGGFGTVYKGILPNKIEVAVKKSKIADQTQMEQFINEILILSNINSRNVVKLLGCCLETEVPLLVYEFIANGTLFHHIHEEGHKSSISWENRLRIATETASAIAYLHSSISPPIIHRDIKSTNVLLDDNFMAKVSDFGASRLVPLDQMQLTTLVKGTLGYLDPEYMHTSQLTEKSDVYSFGVLLAELMIGKMVLSFERSEKERNFAMYFVSSMKENRLFQILEDRVVHEGNTNQLQKVAELAKRCLRLVGDERPTMKEVEMELEGLRRLEVHPWNETNPEENEHLLDETLGFQNSSTIGFDSLRNEAVWPLDNGR